MKEADKIVKKAAKEALAPYGIYQKGQTRAWHDNNDWFITIIEYQRARTPGASLNIGISFLWTPKDYLSYDYWHDTIDPMSSTVEQFYACKDESTFYRQMQHFSKKSLDQALFYRRFADINLAKSYILKHKSLMEDLWGAWNKAMICFMTEDLCNGRQYFSTFSKYVHQHNEWINNFVKAQTARFMPVIDNAAALKALVYDNIASQRDFFTNTKDIKQNAKGKNT